MMTQLDSNSYLARPLNLLEVLAGTDTPVSLSHLATASRLPMSTTSRILKLLCERSFAARSKDGQFSIGPRFTQVGLRAASRLDGMSAFRAAADTIAAATGESASVGLLLGSKLVLVARREPDASLRAVARVGDVMVLTTTSMGKAMLGAMDANDRSALVGHDSSDVENFAAIAQEIDEAALCGFAKDEEQFAVGLRCRGVPIVGLDGRVVGGLSVAGPAARFTLAKARESIPLLKQQARELARANLIGLNEGLAHEYT